jgi:hypothetical protein
MVLVIPEWLALKAGANAVANGPTVVIPEWLAPKAATNAPKAVVNGTSNPRVVGSKGCHKCSKGHCKWC